MIDVIFTHFVIFHRKNNRKKKAIIEKDILFFVQNKIDDYLF